jgi:hypothetical protein
LPSSVSRKRPERRDAIDDHRQIVLTAEAEHGVDEIVPRAFVAQIHLETWQAQVVLQRQPDHAQRRAAQRIRVFRAGRLLVDGPEADQRVELVGERHGDRDRRRRHAVAGPCGL